MDAAQKWMKTFSNEEIKEGAEALRLAFQRSAKRRDAGALIDCSVRMKREIARRGYRPRDEAKLKWDSPA